MKKHVRLLVGILCGVIVILGLYSINSHQQLSQLRSSVAAEQKAIQEGNSTQRTETYINGLIYQFSAEVAGLQKQAYELATLKLDQKLADNQRSENSKPLALISDIDDTLISDAGYIAQVIFDDPTWDNGPWDGYYDALKTTACSPIPGALDFLNHAASKGVEVFYITNRDNDQHDLTVAQLQHWGFPNADDAHVLVMNKEGSSDKTERRAKVLEGHEVIMYCGDNIGDFTADFKPQYGSAQRSAMATQDEFAAKWGTEWIVLPNATYGDYVSAAWSKDKELSPSERANKIKAYLQERGYKSTSFENWFNKKK